MTHPSVSRFTVWRGSMSPARFRFLSDAIVLTGAAVEIATVIAHEVGRATQWAPR